MQVYLRFQKSLTTRFNFKKKSITSSKTFHRMLDNSGTEDPQQADNSKMPTSSLFGRLQKGMANIKSKNKPPNSKKYNFSDAYEIHSSTARLDQQRAGRGNLLSYRTAQHHSKRVSLINPPRSGYRYREDAVLEADREDSFEEDEEFDSDADGGARKRKIGSLMQKEKDIFT